MARFRDLMDDDLNTPGAAALLFELVRKTNTDEDRAAAATAHEIARVFGLELRAASDELSPEIAAFVRPRDEARRTRDFAEADRLRDELQARGWVVKDTPDGTQVHR